MQTGAAELFDRGNALLSAGDAPAAADAFRACLDRAPNHRDTLFNLGIALGAAGRPVEAVDAYLACLRAAPNFGPACLNLATTLRRLALLDHAEDMAMRAIHLLPADPEALLCLAAIRHDQTHYQEAASLYRQALAQTPTHPGALSSLGNTLRALKQFPAALAAHDAAVTAAPDDPATRFNRATCLLAAGDLPNGWPDYEWRWRRPGFPDRGFGPAWRGEPLAGRTILLHAEQGLGDTIQFVRYAPMVAALGARVVLEVQPPLVRLMHSLPNVAQVIPHGAPLPRFDTHCPLLSLPLAFGTSIETIPATPAYLSAEPNPTPDARSVRVGLVWAGSPHTNDAGAHLIDKRRSIPAAELTPLGAVPGVQWVSLQKDPPHGALPALGLSNPIDGITDFAGTAAIVASLDLVIAVDTAVAHLAGALGKPVWLLSRYDGCWRWFTGRDDSPWYPSMRLYRQDRPRDWSSVTARVAADLLAVSRSAAATRSNTPPTDPAPSAATNVWLDPRAAPTGMPQCR